MFVKNYRKITESRMYSLKFSAPFGRRSNYLHLINKKRQSMKKNSSVHRIFVIREEISVLSSTQSFVQTPLCCGQCFFWQTFPQCTTIFTMTALYHKIYYDRILNTKWCRPWKRTSWIMQYSTLAIKWDTFLFAKQDSINP